MNSDKGNSHTLAVEERISESNLDLGQFYFNYARYHYDPV